MTRPLPLEERAKPEPIGRWAVIATIAGNGLEFYDFATYTFFAVYIGRAFFPAGDELATLLLSVATFGVGFLTRPLGAVVIGAYADRAGRKPAMLLTFVLMTVGTLGIALTPGYATIGIAAPLILVTSRLVQGLALGGEIGPATSVLLESASHGSRGLFVSFQAISQSIATLVAGIAGLTLSMSLGDDRLAAWGWRIPFALGLLIVPVGVYLRQKLPETLHAPGERTGMAVLVVLWKHHRRNIALTTLAIMCITVTTYVATYMTTYALTTLGMPSSVAMLSPIALGLVTTFTAFASGRMSDRYDRRRLMIGSRVAVMLATYPAFLLLVTSKTAWALIFVTVLIPVLSAPGSAAAMVTLGEIFPKAVRSSGVSITYALIVTLFGGTTQLVVAWLIKVTGSALSPAWYVMATSLVSVWAILRLPIRAAED